MRYSTTEFETLYTQFFPPAMGLAMSILHEEDEARDVVQEVFVKIWESESLIENPRAFILRAVRNSCINRANMLDTREKIKRRLSLDPDYDDTDMEERHRAVSTAVSELLTVRERQVVEKIYSEGMSYKQTAECFGVSVAAVNKNIVGALKKLRNHFNRHKS
ncbi:MAG: sigma-70 family RNA polymerase sigma factor [Muribaculaceae bacterium]|nr:sigma-70 family RNA polymerase sigma factor [Muribaculaceae bacterium]